MSNTQQAIEPQTITLCGLSDLIPNSGICAEVDGQQIALFYLPSETPQVYAIGNWDPIGKAHVLSRGMVGDIGGKLVVASPLYKQHFDLLTGECLENDQVSVSAFSVSLVDDQVLLSL